MKAKVVGVTFRNEENAFDRQEIIAKLTGKEKVYLKREPKNKFDRNAVAVMLKRTFEDIKLGYLRAELAAFLADMWPKYKFTARICEIRSGDLDEKVPYGLSVTIKKIDRSMLKNKFGGEAKKGI